MDDSTKTRNTFSRAWLLYINERDLCRGLYASLNATDLTPKNIASFLWDGTNKAKRYVNTKACGKFVRVYKTSPELDVTKFVVYIKFNTLRSYDFVAKSVRPLINATKLVFSSDSITIEATSMDPKQGVSYATDCTTRYDAVNWRTTNEEPFVYKGIDTVAVPIVRNDTGAVKFVASLNVHMFPWTSKIRHRTLSKLDKRRWIDDKRNELMLSSVVYQQSNYATLVVAPSDSGKAAYVSSKFKNPLVVNDLLEIRHLRHDNDAIIVCGVSFATAPFQPLERLCTTTEDRKMVFKQGDSYTHIPAGLPIIFTTDNEIEWLPSVCLSNSKLYARLKSLLHVVELRDAIRYNVKFSAYQ